MKIILWIFGIIVALAILATLIQWDAFNAPARGIAAGDIYIRTMDSLQFQVLNTGKGSILLDVYKPANPDPGFDPLLCVVIKNEAGTCYLVTVEGFRKNFVRVK